MLQSIRPLMHEIREDLRILPAAINTKVKSVFTFDKQTSDIINCFGPYIILALGAMALQEFCINSRPEDVAFYAERVFFCLQASAYSGMAINFWNFLESKDKRAVKQ